MKTGVLLLAVLSLALSACDGITFVQRGHQGQKLLEKQGENVRCLVPDAKGTYRVRYGQDWCRFPGAVPENSTYPHAAFPDP